MQNAESAAIDTALIPGTLPPVCGRSACTIILMAGGTPMAAHLNVSEMEHCVIVNFADRKVMGDLLISQLQRELFALVDQRKHRIVLNFSNVEYLASTALDMLIDLQQKLRSLGKLAMCCIDGAIQEVLHITKLDKYFTIFAEEQPAIEFVIA